MNVALWSLFGILLFSLGVDILTGGRRAGLSLLQAGLSAAIGTLLIVSSSDGVLNFVGAIFGVACLMCLVSYRRQLRKVRALHDEDAADHLRSLGR